MVDEVTGKVVDKDDKSRGYEISKGKYIEIEPEEVKAIQVESTHTLDIDKFVPVDEIDRRYFDRPYYVVPDGKAGEEAFAVIRDAMKDKGRVALARIVLTSREHIMAIEPMGKILLGTLLRYDYDVHRPPMVASTLSCCRSRQHSWAQHLHSDEAAQLGMPEKGKQGQDLPGMLSRLKRGWCALRAPVFSDTWGPTAVRA